VLVHRSQTHLSNAIDAFQVGDCRTTAAEAIASHAALDSRPEPFELLAYCEARAGRNKVALRAIDAAIARDPHDWEFHYDQAIIRAASGLDPRPATRAALALNPLDSHTRAAQRWFLQGSKRLWRKRGRQAPTVLPPR
jgi:Flp pilus assembly protein TadD